MNRKLIGPHMAAAFNDPKMLDKIEAGPADGAGRIQNGGSGDVPTGDAPEFEDWEDD